MEPEIRSCSEAMMETLHLRQTSHCSRRSRLRLMQSSPNTLRAMARYQTTRTKGQPARSIFWPYRVSPEWSRTTIVILGNI